ncbi:amidohydrolase family protein [Terrilactibacillus laevilacticus]|uniref:Amidohydrolase family protein n=1 Tax=Terrilactibacillus laevilacticus TaxID=1380157 RepID=A0ABW5PMU8_9BACI|nr:amidohydrolase [Terrilactibacillus laevilacticus]
MKNLVDLIIKNCSLITSDFEIKENQSVVINEDIILAIDTPEIIEQTYYSKDTLDGKGKLLMPGLVDAHTHISQQFLRGRIADEYPMIWSRILVPFESSLNETDAFNSAQLCCLEMIKSGTTAFAESGGVHMHKVAEVVVQSGLRGAITCSTMDQGPFIPDSMKSSPLEAAEKIENLYKEFHGAGNGRIQIWFALRQVMTSTPALIELMARKAKEYKTGLHIHLSEHRDEVSYCLQNYQKRPAEVFDQYGALGPNLLAAHSVVLTESEIDLMKDRKVNIVHNPRSNFGSHGFPKTPRLMQHNMPIGMGTDGAAGSSLSLFDEMRVFRSGLNVFWGLPIFDPLVIPAKELLKMATVGGASALMLKDQIGTIEIGKKADLILLNIDQPHLSPTHKLISTIIECATSKDVEDSIIDGKIVMKNRQVLTLDEEKIMFESKQALKPIAEKAGI